MDLLLALARGGVGSAAQRSPSRRQEQSGSIPLLQRPRVWVAQKSNGTSLAPRRGVAEACAERRVPFHRFSWQPGMQPAGLLRGAIYLVRPDGYIALADPHVDPERLRRYFDDHVTPASRLAESITRDARPVR
jgi:hypothetical protein